MHCAYRKEEEIRLLKAGLFYNLFLFKKVKKFKLKIYGRAYLLLLECSWSWTNFVYWNDE